MKRTDNIINVADTNVTEDALTAYLASIGNYTVLTAAEEYKLAVAARNGDKAARDKLICHNLKLVVSVAKHAGKTGEQILEAITAGNEGLFKAIEKFDPDKGYKFSTYAVFWIRQSIMRDRNNNSRMVRLPVHFHELISKETRSRKELEDMLGRTPEKWEIAEYMGESVEKIEEIEKYRQEAISIDINVGDEKETSLGDLIEDESALSPEEAAVENELGREVGEMIKKLSDKEMYVIRRRFGFNGKPCTLGEIGEELNLSRERIRQIERKALAKLSVVANQRGLQEFIA